MTSIGKVLLATYANRTGFAKRLEKNGFLIRKGDPNDERLTILEITPKGKQTLLNLSGSKDKNIERYLEDFTDEERSLLLQRLRGLLRKQRG